MEKKKIFIIGSNGLLGSELVRQFRAKNNFEIFTSDRSDEGGIDITNEESITKFFTKIKPDSVINCAAFTNVDACESEDGFKVANEVNGFGPGKLSRICKEFNSDLVHISTDYVFGTETKDGFKEDFDQFKPLNKYGETKLLGEKEITTAMDGIEDSNFKLQNPKQYIVRTSWLFGIGATNFIAKIIEYAKQREFLEVVTDEISSPTFVKDLSESIIYLAENRPQGGIYHVSGLGHCSRYDFAKKIIEYSGLNTEIRPTTMDKFPRKTQIAKCSYLINTKLPQMRKWEDMVKDYIENYHG